MTIEVYVDGELRGRIQADPSRIVIDPPLFGLLPRLLPRDFFPGLSPAAAFRLLASLPTRTQVAGVGEVTVRHGT